MDSRQKYPQLADSAWLRDQYEVQRKSCGDIALEVGCSRASVEQWLHKHGIQARGRYPGKWKPKPCPRCGTVYTPTGPAQKFCSLACRPDVRNCEECGKEFRPKPPQKDNRPKSKGAVYPQKYCSMDCRKANWARTSAHRYVGSEGYIVIKVPPTMSRRTTANGYVELNVGEINSNGGRVMEHRWVMEQRLGRSLLPHEEVHHRNGHRDDNDRCPSCPGTTPPPEVRGKRLHCAACGWKSTGQPNLELWTVSQPKGQRVEDKMEWALGFLSQYGDVSFQPFLPDSPGR